MRANKRLCLSLLRRSLAVHRSRSTRPFGPTWAAASDDAAAKRVIIDQSRHSRTAQS